MKNIILITATILSASASYADTTCSDSKGTTRYSVEAYEGGAAPRPGMQMSDEQVIVDNVLVSETKTYCQKPTVKGPVTVTFDESTLHNFVNENSSIPTRRIYGEKATLTGGSLSAPIEVYFMCSYYFLPVP